MPKKKSTPELNAADLAALHLHSLAEGKRHYKIADAALDKLLEQTKVGSVLDSDRAQPDIGDDGGFVHVDHFTAA